MNAPAPPGFFPSVTQPAIHIITYGSEPQHIQCPYCRTDITTTITRKSNTKTHVIACLLCIFGCWPCVPCPYCINSCQTANHYCPQCNTYLGKENKN
ncbi:lipopolysaccharide-induced tumor necrosis factor-alpha factor [Cephus cinctus]|uniref:Lipopolysaccharide-induced tumor necrosis factor-alpha factor n=1 Tax=Cephus cinctus TaxID=211228 RepID=A0AAJ7BLQ2_CEPCN|nr:lipopolysaccharide-induced tumor necrosis factor-alpha factor [Cephus cinctus]